jgi:hypothetical protein
VKPFVKRQKTDAADAEAICEAAGRPTMRFVAPKSEAAQAAALVVRARDLLVRQRTQIISARRGHLAEFGKQDFLNLPEEDAYRYPAGERLRSYDSNVERGLTLRRYWTTACQSCPIKSCWTTGPQRRITRWEHEDVLEAVQRRLDENPQAMRQWREVVEHPFGTIKMWMGATHFLMKRLPKVANEMALHVLAYNLTWVLNSLGVQPLMAALRT